MNKVVLNKTEKLFIPFGTRSNNININGDETKLRPKIIAILSKDFRVCFFG